MSVEAGTYRARAVAWGVAPAAKGDQIGIEFQLVDYDGLSSWYYGSFSDAAWPYTMKALRACGCDDPSKIVGTGDDSGINKNEVEVKVGPDTYEGKTRMRVLFVNEIGGVALKGPLKGAELQSFAERMRAKMALHDGKQNGAGGSAPAPKTDKLDDLPF